MAVEIYFHDLTEEAQEKVLAEYGVLQPDEMNWDITPLFILEFSGAEEEEPGEDSAAG